mgnify:CR=1 FL=1
MADYTPTNDVFGRFIEGLKMGQQLQENKAKRVQDALEAQYKAQTSAIARRTENANFDYISGGNIHTGEEYDIATKMSAQPDLFPMDAERRDVEDITANKGFDSNATGYARYDPTQKDAEQYMAQAGNIDRLREGLKQMGKPMGLNVQTDPETGMQYIPGTKRGEKPTITSIPANPTLEVPAGGTTPIVTYNTGVGRKGASAEQTNMVPMVNTQTGQSTLVPKGTMLYTPVGAAQMADTTTRLSSLTQSLNEFERLLQNVPEGRFKGNLAETINTFTGYFPEVATAKGLGGVLKPLITRVLGGDVGNLAAAEQIPAQRLTEALITRTGTERKQAFKVLRQLIAYRQQANELRKVGTTGLWGDPLREVLKDNVQFTRFIKAVDAGKLNQALQAVEAPTNVPATKKVYKAF